MTTVADKIKKQIERMDEAARAARDFGGEDTEAQSNLQSAMALALTFGKVEVPETPEGWEFPRNWICKGKKVIDGGRQKGALPAGNRMTRNAKKLCTMIAEHKDDLDVEKLVTGYCWRVDMGSWYYEARQYQNAKDAL